MKPQAGMPPASERTSVLTTVLGQTQAPPRDLPPRDDFEQVVGSVTLPPAPAISASLSPIIAATELRLDPLHAEALRLLTKHCAQARPETFERLQEVVSQIGLRFQVSIRH